MMKRRNEEGYVLVYVMVVVFVLCAIALALMSGTLHTLQTQEAMVQRMEDKYEAMGEIERVVAEMELCTASYSDSPLTETDTLVLENCDHEAAALSKLKGKLLGLSDRYVSIQSDDGYTYSLLTTLSESSVQVPAEIEIEIDCNSNCVTDTLTQQKFCHSYSIKVTDLIFSTYTIGGDS